MLLLLPESLLKVKSQMEVQVNFIMLGAGIMLNHPVILYQPENEYSGGTGSYPFPNANYLEYVEAQVRNAGIVVPFMNNDAWSNGIGLPGTVGGFDIYGYDNYP
jgi:hypothetical protein